MESIVGLAFCVSIMFIMFQFRGVLKKEAKAMEAESTAQYAKRYAKSVKKANDAYNRISGKNLLTLDEIEARLDGDFQEY